jgi:hypothetical protein
MPEKTEKTETHRRARLLRGRADSVCHGVVVETELAIKA